MFVKKPKIKKTKDGIETSAEEMSIPTSEVLAILAFGALILAVFGLIVVWL